MGNMGMADSEWHEKSERTARERDRQPVTPEPVEALVERLEEALRWQPGEDITRRYDMKNAQAALTELAERVKAAEVQLAEIEEQAPPTPDEWHRLNERAEAAERERNAVYRQAQLNIADAVEYRTQRDELVEAAAAVLNYENTPSRSSLSQLRSVVAKVRGEADTAAGNQGVGGFPGHTVVRGEAE